MSRAAIFNQTPLAARLRLRFLKDLSGTAAEVPATVRVQAGTRIWKQTVMVPIGTEWSQVARFATVEVPAGPYGVELFSPAGDRITAEGEIADGATVEVSLQGRHSQHEWLSWSSFAVDQKFLRSEEPAARRITRRNNSLPWLDVLGKADLAMPEGLGYALESAEYQQPALRKVMGTAGRIRFWQRGSDEAWVAAPAVAYIENSDDQVVVLRVPQSEGPPGAHLLAEVAGSKTRQSEFCMVPLRWATEQYQPAAVVIVVDVRPAIDPSRDVPRLRARTSVMDSDLAQFSGYLRQGDLKALQAVNESFAPRAEELLAGKLERPFLATAAALALLKTRQLDLLHDWTRNLAMWFPDLPDGPVIRAWHLLYTRRSGTIQVHEGESPRQLLLEAAGRGLPVFAESLRLLVSGLRLLNSPEHREVAGQLAKYERYLWATDSDEEFACFRAAGPDGTEAAELQNSTSRTDWTLEWENRGEQELGPEKGELGALT